MTYKTDSNTILFSFENLKNILKIPYSEYGILMQDILCIISVYCIKPFLLHFIDGCFQNKER